MQYKCFSPLKKICFPATAGDASNRSSSELTASTWKFELAFRTTVAPELSCYTQTERGVTGAALLVKQTQKRARLEAF